MNQTAIHEASAWLRTTVADRTQQLQQRTRDGARVVAYLSPGNRPACDRCGATATYCQIYEPSPQLTIIASICDTCHDLEVGQR